MSYSTRYLDDAPHATVVHPADIGLIWRVRYWAATSGQQVPFDVPGFPFSESDALQGILASSAKLTSYKQNESSENLSDIFKHLKELLKVWEDKTTDAVAAGGSGAARFGSVRRKPATVREYPEW